MHADSRQRAQRRRLQMLAGCGVVGAGIGIASYLLRTAQPPNGHSLASNVSDLSAGKLRVLDWHGRTLWILRRTEAEVAMLAEGEGELIDPRSEHSPQPENCRNRHRSVRAEWFVAIGQCTHQGCTPQLHIGSGRGGEFLCPCHTSRFDLAGRVFRSGPARDNLVIPVYRFASDERIVVGES